VLALVAISAAFWIPRVATGSTEAQHAGQARQAQDRHLAVVSSASLLSPVFSAEVHFWDKQIAEWSTQHNLDPDVVATIMQIESCGDPGALSSAGAQGLFQVMPFHFQSGEDAFDPETNAFRGLSYYRQQLRETEGDVYLSFAGYNGGSAASSSSWDHWSSETQRYFVWSKGIYEDAKAGLPESPTLQRWLEAGGASLCRQAAARLGIEAR
jgi:soluble lytic murein transglycosylase-like protein